MGSAGTIVAEGCREEARVVTGRRKELSGGGDGGLCQCCGLCSCCGGSVGSCSGNEEEKGCWRGKSGAREAP